MARGLAAKIMALRTLSTADAVQLQRAINDMQPQSMASRLQDSIS